MPMYLLSSHWLSTARPCNTTVGKQLLVCIYHLHTVLTKYDAKQILYGNDVTFEFCRF